jgi:SsrA-binding protein
MRKLLLHKREVKKIIGLLSKKGVTFIPLEVYFSSTGFAKVKMAIAEGKKLYDKREKIKKETQEREISRAIKKRA